MAAEERKPPAELQEAYELELDRGEEYRVRKHRERYLLREGFSEFGAFRLSMRFDIEKERAADLLKRRTAALGVEGAEAWVIDQLFD